jgi:hypothetical protein
LVTLIVDQSVVLILSDVLALALSNAQITRLKNSRTCNRALDDVRLQPVTAQKTDGCFCGRRGSLPTANKPTFSFVAAISDGGMQDRDTTASRQSLTHFIKQRSLPPPPPPPPPLLLLLPCGLG